MQIHPDHGYQDGDIVTVSSEYGSQQFVIKNSPDLRMDCLVITVNAIGLNYLTPSILSEEGESACYQEVKVTIDGCGDGSAV